MKPPPVVHYTQPQTPAHLLRPGLKLSLFRAQFERCPYCPVSLRHGDHSADHVVPRSKGGGNSARNKVMAHKVCNQAKDNRMPTACELLFRDITHEIRRAMRGLEPKR